jgi:hypothetical protein
MLQARPEQLVTIGAMIEREWGSSGYAVEEMHNLGCVLVARVRCSDGGRFFVMTDRYGNTDHLGCEGYESESFDRGDLMLKVEALHAAACVA